MIGQQTFLLDKWPRPKKIDPNSPDSLSLVKSVGVWGRDYVQVCFCTRGWASQEITVYELSTLFIQLSVPSGQA